MYPSVAPIGRAQLTLSSHYSPPEGILSSDRARVGGRLDDTSTRHRQQVRYPQAQVDAALAAVDVQFIQRGAGRIQKYLEALIQQRQRRDATHLQLGEPLCVAL